MSAKNGGIIGEGLPRIGRPGKSGLPDGRHLEFDLSLRDLASFDKTRTVSEFLFPGFQFGIIFQT